LLVEDDFATSSALAALLSRRGWKVEVAETLGQALDRVEAQAPDWVILDLMLPDGNGIALLRKLRAEGHRTRIAVTTGISDPERLDGVLALRPDLLLIKPIDFCELIEGLER
jgi:DNA-binding response OmpR family regulator